LAYNRLYDRSVWGHVGLLIVCVFYTRVGKELKMALSDILSLEIKRIYPDIKPYLADRYADKYVSVVLEQIRQAMLRPPNWFNDQKTDELTFSKESATRQSGRQGQTNEYLFDFMARSPQTRLIDITFRGNIGKLSRARLNPIYKDRIMYELLEMPTQALTDSERKEIRDRGNVVIETDPGSLASFIERTEQQTRQTAPGRYRDRLVNNLLRARELYLEQQEVDGRHYLMEYWETADTGRQYGHYNSLQRMSQEVRHAALGVCHKYDFQAHSFAVMAGVARTIDPTIKIAQVEDYIRYRTAIRQRIARDVGVTEDQIKRVFTSLGFGARPINNPYNSIRRTLSNEQAYNKLIDQTEFKYIFEELELINNTIDTRLPQEDFTWYLDRTYQHRKSTGHKKTRSQRLAWIYQNTEAYITQEFIRIIRESTSLEPLMTVHDCIYYRQKLPSRAVIDAQVLLRDEYPYVRVEHEAIYPISTRDHFDTRFDNDQQAELEHKQRIHEEEHAARGYTSAWNQSLPKSRSIGNPFDRFQIAKELPDYVEYNYELEDYR